MLQCQALGGVTLSQEAQNFQREFLMTEGKTTNLVLVSVNQSPKQECISKITLPHLSLFKHITYEVSQEIEK